MSQTETHKGRLVEFPRKNEETDKNYLQRLLGEQFLIDRWQESVQDYIYENDLYTKLLYYKETLYKNEDHLELDEDVDIFIKTDRGIEYFISFYNGGTCLTEMLEEGIDRVNKK